MGREESARTVEGGSKEKAGVGVKGTRREKWVEGARNHDKKRENQILDPNS
jgi:hypothetical protein